MLGRIAGSLRRRKPIRHVTIYGKPGCHLCDDALAVIQGASHRYTIDVRRVDIRSDPDLFRRYDIRIPVVVVDGGGEIEAPITERSLLDALRRGGPQTDATD